MNESADKLRAFADSLDAMKEKGYELDDSVADDYGFALICMKWEKGEPKKKAASKKSPAKKAAPKIKTGNLVAKDFVGKLYRGKIASFSSPYYKVKYKRGRGGVECKGGRVGDRRVQEEQEGADVAPEAVLHEASRAPAQGDAVER